MKLLANALENWNQTTGTLDRLDVDPLPHQIHIVHRILSSGNTNWLIADDVGLGKTIEVGLLMAALKRRRQARRVLIVCPASLLVQWQDDMQFKFGQRFQIYNRDFVINDIQDWKIHDHVIISLDLAKRDEIKQSIKNSGEWDLIVFDEAHRLTRHITGEHTQRYSLARELRALTDSLILLTATPHQGVQEKFISILELVRPDLRHELYNISLNPALIRDVILRNRKSEVTDANGVPIFKGVSINRCEIPMSDEVRRFSEELSKYLREGYGVESRGGSRERAIGFVMTIYRKLASSSIAAIDKALNQRLNRLKSNASSASPDASNGVEDDESIENFDELDQLAHMKAPATEFFTDEISMLECLTKQAKLAMNYDGKIEFLLNEIINKIHSDHGHLLIFTEYRATQQFLKQKIMEAYTDMPEPVLIHGGMKLDEKLESMKLFKESVPILISTEAGGEGLNLHHNCHIMVNYDLPWNPSRLVQRMGRLYRYGQDKIVIVFNLHSNDSFDNQALSLMLGKIDNIAKDMAPVGRDYHERLYQDILGDLLEQIDFENLLLSLRDQEIKHVEREIDNAVEHARHVMRLQDEILSYADSYTPESLSGTIGLSCSHVHVLLRDGLDLCGFENVKEVRSGKAIRFTIPESLVGHYKEFSRRRNVIVTADRRYAQEHRDVAMMDFESPFFSDLIAQLRAQSFDGIYAVVRSQLNETLSCYHVRWQNDQGKVRGQELVIVSGNADGPLEINAARVIDMLSQKWGDANTLLSTNERNRIHTVKTHFNEIEKYVRSQITPFKHPNDIVLLQSCDANCAEGI